MCSNTSTTFEQAIQTAHANAQKALHAWMHWFTAGDGPQAQMQL